MITYIITHRTRKEHTVFQLEEDIKDEKKKHFSKKSLHYLLISKNHV